MANSNQTFRGKASPDTSGVAYFVDLIESTTPGSPQTIHTETIAVNTKYNLLKIYASCRHECIIKVELDSNVISSIRTGPGDVNAEYTWLPFREASAGQLLEIKLEAMGSKPVSDIEVFLTARSILI